MKAAKINRAVLPTARDFSNNGRQQANFPQTVQRSDPELPGHKNGASNQASSSSSRLDDISSSDVDSPSTINTEISIRSAYVPAALPGAPPGTPTRPRAKHTKAKVYQRVEKVAHGQAPVREQHGNPQAAQSRRSKVRLSPERRHGPQTHANR